VERGQVHFPTSGKRWHGPGAATVDATRVTCPRRTSGNGQTTRLDLPGIPQKLFRRGNNCLPCFLDEADRRRYLTLLGEALLDTGCKLRACVLMDNHLHLLATPPEISVVARLMQKPGPGYVGQFNARHRRTGTWWEGRYQPGRQRKLCVALPPRYIELNPVRHCTTDDPAAYPWSSCASHCGLSPGCHPLAVSGINHARLHSGSPRPSLPPAAARNPVRRRPESHPNLPSGNNETWVDMTAARCSQRRPNASPACGPLTSHHAVNQTAASEPDPLLPRSQEGGEVNVPLATGRRTAHCDFFSRAPPSPQPITLRSLLSVYLIVRVGHVVHPRAFPGSNDETVWSAR
jgi:REP element-mobilizing transposase RayT